MPLQETCHGQCVLLVGLHAERQRGGAPHDQPRVEGRQHAAVVDAGLEAQGRDVVAPAQHRPAHRVPVPADVLGQRVHGVVRTQLQRARGDRRGEGGIDGHADAAVRRSDPRHGRDVGQAHDRVGGCFEPDQLRCGTQRRLDVARIGGVGKGDVDPQARQRVAAQFGHPRVVGVRHDDVVAALQQREEEARRRGHPRAEAETGRGALQRAQLGLQLGHGGVRPPRVEVAGVFVHVVGGEAGRVPGDEGGGHDQIGGRGAGGWVGALSRVDGGGAEAGGHGMRRGMVRRRACR